MTDNTKNTDQNKKRGPYRSQLVSRGDVSHARVTEDVQDIVTDGLIFNRKLLGINTQPIMLNQIVHLGFYLLKAMGKLILEGASRLDAFSVYPFPT